MSLFMSYSMLQATELFLMLLQATELFLVLLQATELVLMFWMSKHDCSITFINQDVFYKHVLMFLSYATATCVHEIVQGALYLYSIFAIHIEYRHSKTTIHLKVWIKPDMEHLDEAKVVPSAQGQLVWDATCPDNWPHPTIVRLQVLEKLHLLLRRKRLTSMLCLDNCFVPKAIETLGAFGPKTLSFMKE